jgi:8-oxo-dGTP pyrophosphatase MutT (NUDIX family)
MDVHVGTNDNPAWASSLIARLDPLEIAWTPPHAGERPSAVLALLGSSEDPDLVLTLRAAGLEHHGGQISLPGGGREVEDVSPTDTALREAREEIGLPPSSVHPVGQLHTRDILVSQNRVVPIVGLWSSSDPICVCDEVEVEQVFRWSVSDLADPANRVTARHPRGTAGPAWQMGDLFLWGFTANIVDALLRLGGWERPWDMDRIVDVPPRFRS